MSEISLDDIDRAILGGEMGAAAAHAMRQLVTYGGILDADHFIGIQSAHIDGILYHGPSSIDFVRRFVDMGGKVRVPTTLNVAAVDVVHPGWHQGDPNLIPAQEQLTALHEQLGCIATLTCAPYQRMVRPLPGEHVAWAESNAITFVNSVLGARTDRYGDFTDLYAALTGRVPCVGLHRSENRAARIIFDVPPPEATDLPRDIYFACLGYLIGGQSGERVPAIVGLPSNTNEDELKALGASAASAGAVAMFHAVGITPEAPNLDAACQGSASTLERHSLSAADLDDALSHLCRLEIGEPVAAMCLGTPHFSLTEFEGLAAAVQGRRAASHVEVYVSTSREIAAQVEHDPAFAAIGAFGVNLLVDTCSYLAPVVRNIQGAIVTNSGKWAHYGPGNLKRRVGLMTLQRCIASAECGRVVAP